MPIIREWRCNKCGHDFERIRPECPACHGEGRRVFNSPPHISTGSAKRTDAILQHQFDKMGISNFSNTQGPGGPNRVTWKPRKFGSRSSGGQPEIVPTNTLQNMVIGRNQDGSPVTTGFDQSRLVQDGAPYAVPRDIGSGIPLGVPIGGRPQALFNNTRIVGKLDSDGKSIKRVG